jgi:hypothetical protein
MILGSKSILRLPVSPDKMKVVGYKSATATPLVCRVSTPLILEVYRQFISTTRQDGVGLMESHQTRCYD